MRRAERLGTLWQDIVVGLRTNAANRRFVLGGVMPINLPQYLRWAIEYHLDSPQGGAAKTNNFATELRLTF